MAVLEIKVALIICSTRTPRIGPSIASWITSLLIPQVPPNITLHTVDLASYPLPLSPSGTVIPAHVPLPLPEDPYNDKDVNSWSSLVSSFQAFIFLTPQYNWSFPAAVKVSIDHLFHEWKGKPALVVSYGARGGGKANEALRGVLNGVRFHGWEGKVELAIGGGESMMAAQEKGLFDEVLKAKWMEGGKGEEIVERWGELLKLVGEERA